MKKLIFAAIASIAFSTAAYAQCVESGSEGTFQYRYCPGGVAYERQRIGYGFGWGEWSRVHPNVQTPCRWLSLEQMWMCKDRRMRCDKGACK